MGKKAANIPLSGMVNTHPMNVKENEYPLMLNGNIQTDVSGPITLTNEHSNILCFDFGLQKIIGELYVPEEQVTFVWLVDATGGNSEIGYVKEYVYNPLTDQPSSDPCDNCGTVNIEQPPLETVDATATCGYTCITKSSCLAFDINFPVRKGVFKKDDCGSTIYFTDFKNPARALKLNLDKKIDDSIRAITGYTGVCNGEPDTPTTAECVRVASPNIPCTCCKPTYADYCSLEDIDCTKLDLFPKVAHICVTVEEIVVGGSLRAGTYQLGACYANSNGERATRTFAVSNPASIFDPNQTLTDQTDYRTYQGVKFLISDLDSSEYSFIDIFIIGTINTVPSVKKYATVDITSLTNGTLEYVLSDFEKGEDVSIDDVLQIFPIYEKAQEITSSGDTLLLGNLTGPRDLNLQRAVIGMSPSVKWVSSEANEWFYADGANAATYRGYLRDEVYALGIVFERNNTLDTCAYPLIGRAVQTAFSHIETKPALSDPCIPEWLLVFGDASGSFVYDAGYNAFTYVGEWNSFRTYSKRSSSGHSPYETVSYLGNYYICIVSNTGNLPTNLTYWRVIPDPTSACFLAVDDLEEYTNSDVFIPPGCEHGKGETPNIDDYNKAWNVYNTASNSGLICAPEMQGVECKTIIEKLTCHSYRYEVPVEVDATGFFTTDTNTYASSNQIPSLLGITVGMAVTGPGIVGTWNGTYAEEGGTVVTAIDASGVTLSQPANATAGPVTLHFSVAFCADASASCTDATAVVCHPADCYLSDSSGCSPCADNYPTLVGDVPFTPPASCGDDPSGDCCSIPSVDPSGMGCNPGYVRTLADATGYFDTHGEYLLCVDNTLANYKNVSGLMMPYVVKTSSTPVKVIDAGTKTGYKYNILGIQALIPDTADPTNFFTRGTDGALDPVCLVGLQTYTGQAIQAWLLPYYNMPSVDPNNYSLKLGSNQFSLSPQDQCLDYYVTAPLMYMLGNDVSQLESAGGPNITPPCCGSGSGECDLALWSDGDFWGIDAIADVVGEVNNTKYQSYWYKFTATTLQTTVVIKSRIFYKYGEGYGANGGIGDQLQFHQQQGDFRIDVYEDDPYIVPPTWSTGADTLSPATYYYTGAEADQGVLVVGDFLNSTNQVTTKDQLPLIPGSVYYVHIYMLPNGVAKLNHEFQPLPPFNTTNNQNIVAPVIPNNNKSADCKGVGATSGSCCACYFANYAWMNICMNTATSSTPGEKLIAETWEVKCEYDLYHREYVLIDHGCELQTWEYGPFAFWKAETRKYPNNDELWGDLCQQPIRHFKFPDVLVSYLQEQDPFIVMDTANPNMVKTPGAYNPARTSKIFPMGFRVDPEDVKAWLKWAASADSDIGNGPMITQAELNSITGYKLVRGNRVGNKSIGAKGLLYDMWRYNERDFITDSYSNLNSYYPSYPFNDLRNDPYINRGGSDIEHPYGGTANNRFAFLSPETTFNNPTIGYELKLESAVFGDALGNFYTVRDHPKYVLLNTIGIGLAAALAAVQSSADLLIKVGTVMGPDWIYGLANSVPVGAIIGTIGAALGFVPDFFIYAKTWRDIMLGFGVPQNFAKYYAAVGNYHSSGILGGVQNSGNKRRQILNSTYLVGGNISTSDSGILSKINNYQREDSVYFYLKDKIVYAPSVAPDPIPVPPILGSTSVMLDPLYSDSSRFLMSSSQDGKACNLSDRESRVASYYASMKYDVPDQYGDIHDIVWLYTGTCVGIDFNEIDETTVCRPIFGGDQFIARMTQKRKLPFFLDNPVGGIDPANTTSILDWQYHNLSNITDTTYYFNSVGESPASSSGIQFKEVEHKFDAPCGIPQPPNPGIYLKGSMYLFSYGVTSFICESDINLNYRYATDRLRHDFYPHQSDIENWTQETNIPIETPNSYLYNIGYTKQNKENFFCTQPVLYSNAECLSTFRNRVINSIPDKDSSFFTDSWRTFLANDYADFPLINGQLMGLDGIEREKVLVRFDKTSLVFNAFYTMDTNAGTAQIGTGSMFAQKPEEYAKTEIGFGGTQHHAFVSTQYGHYWVDAKRSSVFALPPGAGLEEISQSYSTFFNNNLPFFIAKDFLDFPVDNNYKDVGISIGWDNKFDRLFITKLDYDLKSQWIGIVTYNAAEGKLYNGDTEIFLTDETYFCNKSWTVAYSPLTKSWISFYSFTPNYYVNHENYFQSGINFPQYDDVQPGLWNHLITNKSYQVFYGRLYPFITDVVVKEELVNKQLLAIEYQADFLRFQNDYDYFYNTGATFNKMVIWSENRNSGNLELVPQPQNDLSQSGLYPRINADSTTILVTRKENTWRVNQFFDLVRNKNSNVPPMVYNCHPYLKEVNPLAIQYNKPTFQKSRFTQDYFTLRFINDKYSNYKIVNKWFINNTIKSYT